MAEERKSKNFDMQSFMGTGRLGTDPKCTETDGKVRANFSLAVSIRDRDGYAKPMWFPTTVFGHSAKFVRDYVQKGHLIGFRGELGVWDRKVDREDEDSPSYPCTTLTLFEVKSLTPKDSNAPAKKKSKPPADYDFADGDEEIPF